MTTGEKHKETVAAVLVIYIPFFGSVAFVLWMLQ